MIWAQWQHLQGALREMQAATKVLLTQAPAQACGWRTAKAHLVLQTLTSCRDSMCPLMEGGLYWVTVPISRHISPGGLQSGLARTPEHGSAYLIQVPVAPCCVHVCLCRPRCVSISGCDSCLLVTPAAEQVLPSMLAAEADVPA